MSSSRKSVPCPIAPATTIRFSSLPSLFISAGSIATTIRFNSRGAAVVRARPECCEQLLDQLLLISRLANRFAELGGCLSDCGLGWLRFRALLKQAHQLRRAVIEIALDIILYPLRCWARALRFHLAATNMPANYGAPRKTIPCSRLQHSGRKPILPSRSRHPHSMEQWTADFKTRGESSRQTHTMTTTRRIEANRRNACHSTGPITKEGKRPGLLTKVLQRSPAACAECR